MASSSRSVVVAAGHETGKATQPRNLTFNMSLVKLQTEARQRQTLFRHLGLLLLLFVLQD